MYFLEERNWEKTEYGLFYKKDGIKFIQISSERSFDDVLKVVLTIGDNNVGMIFDDLDERYLNRLRKNRISYIVKNKEFKIFKKTDKKAPNFPSKVFISHKFTPTLIASPTGLEIIDTLLWLSDLELEDTLSGFSKRYSLSRPKLTHLMQAFEVKSLKMLKQEFLLQSTDWWLSVFDNPMTKRKMTPSKTKHTEGYSAKVDFSLDEFERLFYALRAQGMEIELGGMSFLKLTKDMRANEYDLLVNKDIIFDVVRAFSARPAKVGDMLIRLNVTPLIGSLSDERFESKLFQSKIDKGSSYEFSSQKYNLLRVLWGINYPESRVQEQRKYLLEDYLAKARSKYNKYMD